MSDEKNLARPYVVMARAWRPVADELRARLDYEPERTERIDDIIDFIQRHLTKSVEELDRFADEANQVIEVARDQAAAEASGTSDTEIHRAVARMEVCLDHLLESYDDVRCAKPHRRDARGWSLLADIYRNPLVEILEACDQALEFVDDPQAHNRKRGLPADGSADLELSFALYPTAEVEKLTRWSERRVDRLLEETDLQQELDCDDDIDWVEDDDAEEPADPRQATTWWAVVIALLLFGLIVYMLHQTIGLGWAMVVIIPIWLVWKFFAMIFRS